MYAIHKIAILNQANYWMAKDIYIVIVNLMLCLFESTFLFLAFSFLTQN